MKTSDIKKILEKYEIGEQDKENLLKYFEGIEKAASKQTVQENSDKQAAENSSVNDKITELEKKIDSLIQKKESVLPEEHKEKIEELKAGYPSDFLDILSKTTPALQAEILQGLRDQGIYNPGDRAVGGEFTPTLPERNNEDIRPLSEKEIRNMPNDEFLKLKNSGRLDYLIKNNLITD